MSFVIGISQGIQPIIGFNYGAEKYERVRKSYLLALGTATVLSGIAFFCFQVFPRQIISVFGSGSELYFQFSERYFRIYMFLTLINGIQPVTSNFFNSIGKSQLGVFMSLTRQILFLLPLIVIFPLFMGIDGVMYAGPIADAAAAIVCGYFMVRELKELSVMDKKKKEEELWDLYLVNFSHMDKQNFESFEEYKRRVMRNSYGDDGNIKIASVEEVMEEMKDVMAIFQEKEVK